MATRDKEKKKENDREYYLANKERILAYQKKWAKNNREKRRQYCHRYDQSEKGISKSNEWRKSEKGKQKLAEVRATPKHKKYQHKYMKTYRKTEKNLKWRQVYTNKRKQIDVHFKISCLLRNRLSSAIKNKSKKGSAVQLLGCSIEFFKEYIAAKFKKSMTWDNHGKWHIDHVQPLSSFDLEDERQLTIACHYTNLQPLWARINLRKNAKTTQPHQLSLEI